MEPILTIDNLNSFGGNMLRQGDKSQLKYRLRDVGNKDLGISGKSCQVRMYGRNYTTVVYETTATVGSDNTVSFTINNVLPKGTFYLEFTVGDYIFPTDHREFFEITPSGKAIEANIIEIVGKDVLIREVKSQVDTELEPLVTSLESSEAVRVQAEQERVQGYQEIQQIIEDGTLSAVPADGSLTTEKFAPNSVTAEKTDFIKTSPNLLNVDELVENSIISIDGSITERSDYLYSQRISVSPGDSIFYRYIANLAYYDKNDDFISRANAPLIESGFLVVPDNAYYIRGNVREIDYRRVERYPQISISDVEVPYEPYYLRLDNVDLEGKNLNNFSVTNDKLGLLSVTEKNILDEAITPKKTSFIEMSSNLFNINTVSQKGFIISIDGQITANGNYTHSDFIEVIPNESYYLYGFVSVARYDENRNFINRFDVTASGHPTVIPTNCHFIRLNYQHVSGIYNRLRRVNKGTQLLPYEPHYEKLKEVIVGGDAITPDSITTNRLRNDVVTPEKTSFIKEGKNLYNHNTHTLGHIISEWGVITENTSYGYTDKIPVTPGETMQTTGFNMYATYDEYGRFIERYNIDVYGTSQVVPDGVAFIAYNFQLASSVWRNEPRINKGDVLLPYEPYQIQVQDLNFSDGTITPEKTSFIKEGKNLYNPNTHTLGYVINNVGEITENATYGYTDKIPVTPNDTMQTAGFNMYATYDGNGDFISRVNIDAYGDSAVIPDGVAFVAYNFQVASVIWNNRPRIYKGDILLPYEPYQLQLQGITLSDEAVEGVGEKLGVIPNDRFMFDLPVDQLFKADGLAVDDWEGFGRSTTSAEVYAKFDELQATYPDYITKTPLQSDTFGNEIAMYEFNPKRANTSVDTKIPTAFWTLGTHGYEHPPALMFYLMLKRMLEDWRESEALEVLRFNVRFLVIPVVNPSGWDDYTRKTRNGVDIARNFPEQWTLGDESSNTYGGSEPLSEIESQNVSKVIKEHPEIDMMYDFHNFAGTLDTDYFIWIPTSSGSYVQHMVQKLIGRMTHTWQKEYVEWMPQGHDWYAGYSDGTSGGMIQNHAIGNGIKFAATFEIGGRWWIEDPGNTASLIYNTTHRKTGLETLVNWMLINLDELNFK